MSERLYRHPQSPTLAIADLWVNLTPLADGALVLAYTLSGDLGKLRLPAPCPAERRDGLWQHSCFEVFIAEAGSEAYREFNFSPAGHWQAYDFDSYRHGGPLASALAPRIEVISQATYLTLTATLPAADLPPGPHLRLGLCAVLEAGDGRLAYWALRHGPDKPDFHRPDTFALDLHLPE